ncbi:MAG: hypothetical protein AB1714_22320 [Acidobacteriota bacterium]
MSRADMREEPPDTHAEGHLQPNWRAPCRLALVVLAWIALVNMALFFLLARDRVRESNPPLVVDASGSTGLLLISIRPSPAEQLARQLSFTSIPFLLAGLPVLLLILAGRLSLLTQLERVTLIGSALGGLLSLLLLGLARVIAR